MGHSEYRGVWGPGMLGGAQVDRQEVGGLGSEPLWDPGRTSARFCPPRPGEGGGALWHPPRRLSTFLEASGVDGYDP